MQIVSGELWTGLTCAALENLICRFARFTADGDATKGYKSLVCYYPLNYSCLVTYQIEQTY